MSTDPRVTRLGDLAQLIRSKNAGPFTLTMDIMFSDARTFDHVRRSGALSSAVISDLYQVPVEDVAFFVVEKALAFKASIPRPRFQGDIFDSDGHGGQQYAPLIDIAIPALPGPETEQNQDRKEIAVNAAS